MPQVTDIIPQKNKARLNVYLDGKYALALSVESLVKNKIKISTRLTEEQIENLVKLDLTERLLNKTLGLLSFRPRSRSEVEKYIEREFFKEKVTASTASEIKKSVLEKLIKLNLLDDKNFAEWWIDQRKNFKGFSNALIRAELLKKGLSRELVGNLLKEDPIEEIGLAKQSLRKKWRVFGKLTEKEQKLKSLQFLARKGFSWEVAKKAVDSLVEEG